MVFRGIDSDVGHEVVEILRGRRRVTGRAWAIGPVLEWTVTTFSLSLMVWAFEITATSS